jgi:hypothetical protein
MKVAAKGLLILPILLGAAFTRAQTAPPPNSPFPPTNFKHVIVVFQENRTPDNLFQDLFGLTGSNGNAYDIQNTYKDAQGVSHPLLPIPLANNFDLDHSHRGFEKEFTNPGNPLTPGCSRDVFGCALTSWNQFMYVQNTPVTNTDGSKGGLLDPYVTLAKQYGWANFMYQTNQGPSFPAHQIIFSGTSGRKGDDANAVFVAENPQAPPPPPPPNYNPIQDTGCLAPVDEFNWLISPGTAPNETQLVNGPSHSLCFDHPAVPDLLPSSLSWKYYAPEVNGNPFPNNPSMVGYNPEGSIWTAPNSIKGICVPDPTFSQCTGPAFTNPVPNVDLDPADILTDINNCQLPNISWAIPDGRWSDHANVNTGLGPAWVAAIVNAVGQSMCTNGNWNDTAIVVTWDDWGGWFDHEPPVILSGIQGDYQYGFRVPLLVVSGYTSAGYVNNSVHDFGSILNMIEGIFGLKSLGYADARATTDLRLFFPLSTARPFTPIPAVKDASFFLMHAGAPVAPDND